MSDFDIASEIKTLIESWRVEANRLERVQTAYALGACLMLRECARQLERKHSKEAELWNIFERRMIAALVALSKDGRDRNSVQEADGRETRT